MNIMDSSNNETEKSLSDKPIHFNEDPTPQSKQLENEGSVSGPMDVDNPMEVHHLHGSSDEAVIDSTQQGQRTEDEEPLHKETTTESGNPLVSQAVMDTETLNDKEATTEPSIPSSPTSIILGGSIDQPAFALLTGQYEDTKDGQKMVNVPITVLPAILGRTQNTTDEHIFDLGNCKALSRKHAVIFYSDCYGGKLGKYSSEKNDNNSGVVHRVDDEWTYKPPSSSDQVIKKEDIIRPEGVDLPEKGFYAIQCTSKNKLFVNKLRVEQGQIAMLSHKSTIRMAGYMLYFILPESGDDTSKSKTNVITVPHPTGGDSMNHDSSAAQHHPNKKIKIDSTPAKIDPCEGKSLSELLEEFIQAVDNDIFERKHSIISSHIMFHAVKEVAKNKELQEESKKEEGVSRTKIMDLIAQNNLYETWVKKLLTKLEMKTYQSNLSKALMKAGFTRVGTTGRHVKWRFPKVNTVDADNASDEVKQTSAKEQDHGCEEPMEKDLASSNIENEANETKEGIEDDNNAP